MRLAEPLLALAAEHPDHRAGRQISQPSRVPRSLRLPGHIITRDSSERVPNENRALFTPGYIGRVVKALRLYNPQLAFLPTLYWNTIGDAEFIKSYGPLLDGIVFPYADLESTNSLPGQLAASRKWLGENKLLLVNVYAAGSSGTKEHGPRTPEYLRSILTVSRQSSDGIRLYCLPKGNFDDSRFRITAEVFGKWSSPKARERK